MKRLQLTFNDQQKLVRYFQKITQIILHLYTYVNLTPSMVEINNIIDYAHNTHHLIQDFYKTFQKKFVSVQVFNKLENELNQKNQKITQLINLQKNLKIELKVMEDKLNEAQTSRGNNFKPYHQQKQFTLAEQIRKNLLEKQKQKQTFIQEKQNLGKTLLEVKKKRTSLPHLTSSSANLSSTRQKLINLTKKKKSLFVTVPGEGNEVLIQHLMRKISIK